MPSSTASTAKQQNKNEKNNNQNTEGNIVKPNSSRIFRSCILRIPMPSKVMSRLEQLGSNETHLVLPMPNVASTDLPPCFFGNKDTWTQSHRWPAKASNIHKKTPERNMHYFLSIFSICSEILKVDIQKTVNGYSKRYLSWGDLPFGDPKQCTQLLPLRRHTLQLYILWL